MIVPMTIDLDPAMLRLDDRVQKWGAADLEVAVGLACEWVSVKVQFSLPTLRSLLMFHAPELVL